MSNLLGYISHSVADWSRELNSFVITESMIPTPPTGNPMVASEARALRESGIERWGLIGLNRLAEQFSLQPLEPEAGLRGEQGWP